MTTIRVPGSKSYTNRALVMAALTEGPVTLTNPLFSDDTDAMIGALRTLGLRIDATKEALVVWDDVRSIEDRAYELFVSASGTTARFLVALCCVIPGVQVIRGTERMEARPMKDLIDALRTAGAVIECLEDEGQLPVKISSSTLRAHSIDLRAEVSSQFCSALLMIAPYLATGLTLRLIGKPVSKSYIDMTCQCLRDWGGQVSEVGNVYTVLPQPYHRKTYAIEGDFSSAGYFFAIAALLGRKITVEHLSPRSLQGDREVLTFLEQMGNEVHSTETSITVEGRQILPLDVSMERCPDQVMTLAVLAAFADGVTRISGVRSLRVKETERVRALCTELNKMGIRTEDTHDTLTIFGGSPRCAAIDTYDDHRMAMAFSIGKCRLPDLVIRQPEVVRKTFPTFWEEWGRV